MFFCALQNVKVNWQIELEKYVCQFSPLLRKWKSAIFIIISFFRDSLNKTGILILEDARKDRDSRLPRKLFCNECENKVANKHKKSKNLITSSQFSRVKT